jgi:hypothetical protein
VVAWCAVAGLYPSAENQIPLFIDANPRLVEPMNGVFAGVNLAGHLLRISTGEQIAAAEASGTTVRTHMLLMALLSKAAASARRLDVIVELMRATARRGYTRKAARNSCPWGLISKASSHWPTCSRGCFGIPGQQPLLAPDQLPPIH